MIIKITPDQVTKNWEMIKYALVHGDLLDEAHRQAVLNEVLHALLSETAQCFFRLDSKNRQIIAIMITRIKVSNRNLDKYLYIQCIFSFRQVDIIEWQTDWNYIKFFAGDNKCKYIQADSINHKIIQLMNNLGASEIYRTFKYTIMGG